MSRIMLAIIAASLSTLALPALAQAPAEPAPAAPAPLAAPVQSPGYHAHDGFFLQFNAGIGPMRSETSSGGTDWKFSGTAGEFGVAIGCAVAQNLILAGDLWGLSITDPTVEANGSSLDATGARLELSSIGLNLTYYFMPANVYLTVAPSTGVLSPKVFGKTHSTKAGVTIRLAAGKEWWVSDNWGLGLNLQYVHSSNKDQDFPEKPMWSTNWFGIAFSATYN